MKLRKIRITLDVVTAAPIDVLRERRSYSHIVMDASSGRHFPMVVTRAEAEEIERLNLETLEALP